MTFNEEKHLPNAKKQLKGIRGSDGDERQVHIENGNAVYWFAFVKAERHWECIDSDTFINGDYKKNPLPGGDPNKPVKNGTVAKQRAEQIKSDTGIIYIAMNTVNGKAYIGQTKKLLADRIQGHLRDSKTSPKPFYKAIRKYGFDAFEWRILEKVDNGSLDAAEKKWIRHYNERTEVELYNLTEGGQDWQGLRVIGVNED